MQTKELISRYFHCKGRVRGGGGGGGRSGDPVFLSFLGAEMHFFSHIKINLKSQLSNLYKLLRNCSLGLLGQNK